MYPSLSYGTFWLGSGAPCWVHISRGVGGKCQGKPFWIFLSQNTLVTQAPFHWNQLGRDCRNCCSKGNSGPHPASDLIQSWHQHQAGKSWSFSTDWPRTCNQQLTHQKLYITGNNLGQTKTCGIRAGEHIHHLPWSLNNTSKGISRGLILLFAQEALSETDRSAVG